MISVSEKMHMEPEGETLCSVSTYCDQLLTAKLKYCVSVLQVPVVPGNVLYVFCHIRHPNILALLHAPGFDIQIIKNIAL